MHYTLQKLIKGDEEIVNYYQQAKSIWNEIKEKIDCSKNENVLRLANELSNRQIIDFEHKCGGRDVGQEIMAWYGIAQFYTVEDGFGNDYERLQSAKNVYEAFQKSYCSLEVKGYARDVANSYSLEEY